MSIGIDTNVLAYAEGANDSGRQAQARVVLSELAGSDIVMPIQVAGELFRVLVGRMKRTPAEAREVVLGWQDLFRSQVTTPAIFAAAMDLSANHGFSIWDAIIVNASAEAGCRLLLSEDLQHGFVWRGLTIVDPFRPERHPLLAAAPGRP